MNKINKKLKKAICSFGIILSLTCSSVVVSQFVNQASANIKQKELVTYQLTKNLGNKNQKKIPYHYSWKSSKVNGAVGNDTHFFIKTFHNSI